MIFSIQPPALMEKTYEMGAWCFDLPSAKYLESFKIFTDLMEDETLIGLCHLEAGVGLSFLGKPLHRFESKIISTIKKVLPSHLTRDTLPAPSTSEVFTQKEIDRISLDSLRFDKAVALFDPEDCPFLLIGEKYGDWLLALGRIDLLHEMVSRVREKGFIPIYNGQWTLYSLPKAKSLHVAAFATPIHKKSYFFDLPRSSDLIKKFEKPIIAQNPLADGKLLEEPEEAFSFLFDELKVQAAIVGIASEQEAKTIARALKNVSSLIPPRKT